MHVIEALTSPRPEEQEHKEQELIKKQTPR